MDLTKTFGLIRQFEGLKLKAYQDTVGVWTIGYGTIAVNGVRVKKGMTCTKAEAEDWMRQEATECANKIQKWLKHSVTPGEMAALVSLSYNIGQSGLYHSTLLAELNANKPKQVVASEFMKWVHGGGHVIAGLVNRRALERKVFLS
jgi:lysozyme